MAAIKRTRWGDVRAPVSERLESPGAGTGVAERPVVMAGS